MAEHLARDFPPAEGEGMKNPADAAAPPATPPGWATRLLAFVTPPELEDCVAGDLLEQYRDTIVPSRGVRGANRWYAAQAMRAVWRTAGVFLAAALILHMWREAIDELVLTDDYHLRSYVLTYGMIGIAVATGLRAGWRSGRISTGVAAAGAVSLFGWSGAWMVAALLAIAVPDVLYPGGIAELLFLPFMTLPLVLALGAIGAAVGKIGRPAR